MSDPFKIIEPTVISFSGGRTSGYMLWRILQSNQGLPDDAIVVFANTGKEEEATLRFIEDCSVNWQVPIHWVEYQWNDNSKLRFKSVNFDTASRQGEPFMSMIHESTGYLPNPVARICTATLKIRTIDKYLKSLGWQHNENMDWIGIRADEMRRAAKIQRERTPLVSAKVTKHDVIAFWEKQEFNLNLQNNNGDTPEGNCDLCFLKGNNKVLSLIAQKPERAVWWAKMESLALASRPSGFYFRTDRPSYAQMMNYVGNQVDMFAKEEDIACFCGD